VSSQGTAWHGLSMQGLVVVPAGLGSAWRRTAWRGEVFIAARRGVAGQG